MIIAEIHNGSEVTCFLRHLMFLLTCNRRKEPAFIDTTFFIYFLSHQLRLPYLPVPNRLSTDVLVRSTPQ